MMTLRGSFHLLRMLCRASQGSIYSSKLSTTLPQRTRILAQRTSKFRALSTSGFLQCSGKDVSQSIDNGSASNVDFHGNPHHIHRQEVESNETTGIPAPLGIQVFPEIFDRLPPKCTGCGAIFQSKSPSEPGFIRGDKIPGKEQISEADKPVVCQRCFNMKYYNKLVQVNVNNTHVTEFLSHISRRKALILYVVDIMDLPGSVYLDLLDVVGPAKRIILVANKMDMLPQDGRPWPQEERLKYEVTRLCKEHGLEDANIKDVCLVSAKHGFGIPGLVRKIHEHWDQNGDVYMMGCSNSGKTTLFNTLSDLLNVHKKDGNMLHCATVSHWPGTTQSLMRFPLGHWMLTKLEYRLNRGVPKDEETNEEVAMDADIIDKQETSYKNLHQDHAVKDVATISNQEEPHHIQMYRPEFVSLDKEKEQQSWFYDTPGIISENQITSYLTMQELKLLNPTRWIVPRTYIMKPGQTLLVGGLARIDYIKISRIPLPDSHADSDLTNTLTQANKSIFFTVFASPNLPLHVLNTARADDFLQKHAGSDILKIPSGNEKRMALFPQLQSHEFFLTGIGWEESAGDVVLSNAGWAAITAGIGADVTLRAYTPNGRGLGVRVPALLPTSVTQRGARGVRHLGHIDGCAYQAHRSKSPQLIKSLDHDQRGVYSWMREASRVRKQQLAAKKEQRMLRIMEKSLGYTPATRLPLNQLSLEEQETGRGIEKAEEKEHVRMEEA